MKSELQELSGLLRKDAGNPNQTPNLTTLTSEQMKRLADLCDAWQTVCDSAQRVYRNV